VLNPVDLVGPSGLAVISLQKEDSLLTFETTEKLKSFLLCSGPGGLQKENVQKMDPLVTFNKKLYNCKCTFSSQVLIS
jgi:hypothetical protein